MNITYIIEEKKRSKYLMLIYERRKYIMTNLAEVMRAAGVQLTEEEVKREEEYLNSKHRGKTVLTRPSEEVVLTSVAEDDFEPKKTQKDPTPDLVFLPRVYNEGEEFLGQAGYLVWCANTEEMFYAPTKLCLDSNFIYRADLEIVEFESHEEGMAYYEEKTKNLMPGLITRKTCFILDNVSNESYEVYYDTNYPTLKYGKATPNGMFIHKSPNRFHRDMMILELDAIYNDASKKNAGLLTAREMKAHEAIIISDGSWMREVSANAYYYLDATSVIKFTEAAIPSMPEQAILISEIKGAMNALLMCRMKGKRDITYYYDNTSILNIFRNRKTEYIPEVVEYKKLLEDLYRDGVNINFVELHPKTGDDRDTENRALMYFHNSCDKECREITDIFKKDYKSHATIGNREGKTYSSMKQEVKPRGKQGYSKGYNKGQNFNPRKH